MSYLGCASYARFLAGTHKVHALRPHQLQGFYERVTFILCGHNYRLIGFNFQLMGKPTEQMADTPTALVPYPLPATQGDYPKQLPATKDRNLSAKC
jgi:hypothetical protein